MKLFRRRQFESEMDDELGFHLRAYIDDLIRSGVDPREAERRARIEFGGIEATKDECRQAWGFRQLDELRADLRFTLRGIRQNPGFAAVAVVSLALGIGANTAIFGIVDAVMLKVLPVRDPSRLVFIQNVGTQDGNGGPPYPCFELLRDKAKSFAGMAAFSPSNLEVVIDGGREQIRGEWVSGNFYTLLGVRPLRGRALSASDDQTVGSGGPDGPVAVISRAYWTGRFHGDPGIVGRRVHLFHQAVTIVGVLPSELMSLEPGRPVDMAVPMMLSDPTMLRDRGSWWLDIVARLAPNASVPKARAEADTLFQAYMADIQMSAEIRKLAFDHIQLAPAGGGLDDLRNKYSKALTALFLLAGLVLLASCINLANLLLARATGRRREFALRLAIGAGRGRLIRQSLTETLVLVGSGAVLGTALAVRGEDALAAFFAEGNGPIVLDLSLNTRILLFTLVVAALTGLMFGLLPALQATRVDPASDLQSGSRSISGNRAAVRLGRSLVVLQVTLSMVLLFAAGLFVHSLRQLEQADLGFTRAGILTMEVAPERELFAKPEWMRLQRMILDRVDRIPGVQSAGWSTMTPLSGRERSILIDAPGFQNRLEQDHEIHLVSASPEYFATLGIQLVSGRAFEVRDGADASRVAILNEAAARFYFRDSNPIGKIIGIARRPGSPSYEIIGVVKDAKHDSVREEPLRFLYVPLPQSIDRIGRLALSVRTAHDPMTLAAAVRRGLLDVRSTLLITNVSTIDRQVEISLVRERLVSTLSLAFGALALVLACIGLYGILAYSVARRTNEIGLRMALGATGSSMIRLVLRDAATLAAIGILLGIPAIAGVGRMAQALLYGVSPFDFTALAAAVLLLACFAAAAGLVPARRASRLDPMSALRCE